MEPRRAALPTSMPPSAAPAQHSHYSTERLHLPNLLSLVAMSSGSDAPGFSGWRVGELRRYLHERGVSTAGVVERSELLALAEAAASSTAPALPTQPPPPPVGQQGPAAVSILDPDTLQAVSRYLDDPSNQGQLHAAAHAIAGALSERLRNNSLEMSPGVRISLSLLPTAEAEQLIGGPNARRLFGGSGAQLDQLLDGGPGSGCGADGSGAEVAATRSGSVGRREGNDDAATGAVGSAAGSEARAAGGSDSWAAGINSGRSSAPDSGSGTRGSGAAASGAAPAAAATKRCAVCGKAAEPRRKLKRCGGCLKVRYCGVACQSRHWAEGHNQACRRLRNEAAA